MGIGWRDGLMKVVINRWVGYWSTLCRCADGECDWDGLVGVGG